MAGSGDGNLWDFFSLGDTHHAACGDFGSSSNIGAHGSGQAPTPPPITELPQPAPHFGGFHHPTPGGYGRFPQPPAYAGHHLAPHPDSGFDMNASSSAVGGTPASSPPAAAGAEAWPPASMGYGHHQYSWSPDAAWGGSSPPYPPPVPPVRDAQGEGAQCGRGGGRVGRGRGRRGRVRGSAAEPPLLTIGTSANSGIGDDGDTAADDSDDIDYESDNESSASSTADNAWFNGVGPSAQDAAESGPRDPVEEALADLFGSDDEVIPVMKAVLDESRRKREIMQQALLLGMYYYTYLKKNPRRIAKETGIEWVEKTLGNETSCYNMFRMNPPVFEMLHDVLVQSYGLESTTRMSSREALAMFLWMIGPPEPIRQAWDKFTRSMETISRKFEHVLECVCNLGKDIIRPSDPNFSTVHPKIANHKYAPFFNNAIGAIDGTHVKVIVSGKKVGPYFNRSKDKSQNVLAICDFDRRFTFVAAGIPGSAHDWTVLQEVMDRHSDKFPHPSPGKFYLVDSGYPNRLGFLAPYKGVRYHVDDWKQAPRARGKKEIFNQAHSSIRSVIERSFGVLKMKWRILLGLPHYSERKQTQIILACCGLHNFILENDSDDVDFSMDEAELALPEPDENEDEPEDNGTVAPVEEDVNMNALRDEIAAACLLASRL